MSYTSIRKEAKEAFYSALTNTANGFGATFADIQVLKELDNVKKLESLRIEIGASAEPQIAGATVYGWTVTILVQIASNFNKRTKAEHEDACARVEALLLDSTLASRLSTTAFTCQVATPGAALPEAIDDDERLTQYEVELDCFLTGV